MLQKFCKLLIRRRQTRGVSEELPSGAKWRADRPKRRLNCLRRKVKPEVSHQPVPSIARRRTVRLIQRVDGIEQNGFNISHSYVRAVGSSRGYALPSLIVDNVNTAAPTAIITPETVNANGAFTA